MLNSSSDTYSTCLTVAKVTHCSVRIDCLLELYVDKYCFEENNTVNVTVSQNDPHKNDFQGVGSFVKLSPP